RASRSSSPRWRRAFPRPCSPPRSACSSPSRRCGPTTATPAASTACRSATKSSPTSSARSCSARPARTNEPPVGREHPMSTLARHKCRKLKSEINVVPYIDVMLVLLIIFMVTAPLLSLSVDVDLPKFNARSVDSKKDPVIVTVDAEGRYFLTLEGGKAEPIDATELSARLAAFVAQNKDLPVFVAAPEIGRAS